MATDPHEHDQDENPLEHIGEVIPDPWDDPDQADWPNEILEIGPADGPAAAKGVAHVEEV